MLTLAIGCFIGWAVTGTADYFATKRAYRIAHQRGRDAALRQVSGW